MIGFWDLQLAGAPPLLSLVVRGYRDNSMIASFDADGIVIAKYPFPPASVFPRGRVAFVAIRDVDSAAAPPEIRTIDGETLFVSAEQSDAFRDCVENAQLPVVRRIDVWDLLLEPFLDTEVTPEQQEQTLTTLNRIGFTLASSTF